MIRRLLQLSAVALISAAALAGCSATDPADPVPQQPAVPAAVETSSLELEHDGMERTFRITAPADPGATRSRCSSPCTAPADPPSR